jgi:hypothetical protein
MKKNAVGSLKIGNEVILAALALPPQKIANSVMEHQRDTKIGIFS